MATISILTQVCAQVNRTLFHTHISIFKCLDMLQPLLDSAVAVLEQNKAVLDHLRWAKEFMQTIMQLGAIASDVGSSSSQYHVNH